MHFAIYFYKRVFCTFLENYRFIFFLHWFSTNFGLVEYYRLRIVMNILFLYAKISCSEKISGFGPKRVKLSWDMLFQLSD